MAKNIIVDFRMRKIEKEYIKSLGYNIIENNFNLDTYDEISSHPDIYYLKVGQVNFAAPLKKNIVENAVLGTSDVGNEYPYDVPYNVAIIGTNAVHNFKYTDNIVKMYLEKMGYNLINVEQGYSKCSTIILKDFIITSDIKIATSLLDNGIDAMYVNEPDIKLLRRTNKIFIKESTMNFEYSPMQGFIGGAFAVIENKLICFGDIKKLVNGQKIKDEVEKRGYELVYFDGLDVIDYGSVFEF